MLQHKFLINPLQKSKNLKSNSFSFPSTVTIDLKECVMLCSIDLKQVKFSLNNIGRHKVEYN